MMPSNLLPISSRHKTGGRGFNSYGMRKRKGGKLIGKDGNGGRWGRVRKQEGRERQKLVEGREMEYVIWVMEKKDFHSHVLLGGKDINKVRMKNQVWIVFSGASQ